MRARLTHWRLQPLSAAAAIDYLATICRAEGLAYEVAALSLVVEFIGGSPRDLLRALEKSLTCGGEITATTVRRSLDDFDSCDRPRTLAQRSMSRTARKLRIVKAQAGSTAVQGEKYLSWNEIRQVWEIGSFLLQHYEMPLNLRLTLRIQDHRAGADLISGLTHKLGQRLREWCPDANALHWVYRHEADEAEHLVTRLMVAVPEEQRAAALHWLRSRFPGLIIAWRDARNPDCRLRFHWCCVRALSRSLDQTLVGRSAAGERLALVDLLRIPRRWRGPTGTVHCVKKRGASLSLRRPARIAADFTVSSFLNLGDHTRNARRK